MSKFLAPNVKANRRRSAARAEGTQKRRFWMVRLSAGWGMAHRLVDGKNAGRGSDFPPQLLRSRLQHFFVPVKGCHDDRRNILRKNMSPANLQHARSGGMSQSECCAKIQAMRKHDMPMGDGLPHDLPVGRTWITYRRPVSRFPTLFSQKSIPTLARSSYRRGL